MGKELSSFFRYFMCDYHKVAHSLVWHFYRTTDMDAAIKARSSTTFEAWFQEVDGFSQLTMLVQAYTAGDLTARLKFLLHLIERGAPLSEGALPSAYAPFSEAAVNALHHTLYNHMYARLKHGFMNKIPRPIWTVDPVNSDSQWWFGTRFPIRFSLTSHKQRNSWAKTNTGYMMNYLGVFLNVEGRVVDDGPTALAHMTHTDVIVMRVERITLRGPNNIKDALPFVYSTFEEKGAIAQVDPEAFDKFQSYRTSVSATND